MFTNKFHDNDFDGVVLKIPKWFIEINELQPHLNIFLDILKSENIKSKFHPDHEKNIYELENWMGKAENIKNEKAAIRKRKEDEEIRFNRIVSGEVYELEWVNRKAVFSREYVYLDSEGRDIYRFNDMFTNRANLKSAFEKIFKSKIHGFDGF